MEIKEKGCVLKVNYCLKVNCLSRRKAIVLTLALPSDFEEGLGSDFLRGAKELDASGEGLEVAGGWLVGGAESCYRFC